MPSHPIATWITPCNSRNVQVLGTSTRRHTIGLIPSSQTLTCTISAASALAADEAVSMTGLVRFGARVTRPAYRQSPFPVAGTPDILMLSYEAARFGDERRNRRTAGASTGIGRPIEARAIS